MYNNRRLKWIGKQAQVQVYCVY